MCFSENVSLGLGIFGILSSIYFYKKISTLLLESDILLLWKYYNSCNIE